MMLINMPKKLSKISLSLLAFGGSLLLSSFASSADDVRFSDYQADLTLEQQQPEQSRYHFDGVVSLTGELQIQLDMSAPNQANGEIIASRFIPDEEQRQQLPEVVKGPYSAPAKAIAIHLSDEQLYNIFGSERQWHKLSHGRKTLVRQRVSVMFSEFDVSVECDSRSYAANVESISTIYDKALSAQEFKLGTC